jgi:nucleoside-diphosphate-sugar epimerase
VPSAPAVPIREVLQKLEKILGQPVKSRTAGRFLVHLMSLFNPMMRELKETLYMWEEPYRVDHSAFAARFDDAVTPLDQGLAETVAWFRANSA